MLKMVGVLCVHLPLLSKLGRALCLCLVRLPGGPPTPFSQMSLLPCT